MELNQIYICIIKLYSYLKELFFYKSISFHFHIDYIAHYKITTFSIITYPENETLVEYISSRFLLGLECGYGPNGQGIKQNPPNIATPGSSKFVYELSYPEMGYVIMHDMISLRRIMISKLRIQTHIFFEFNP